MEKPQTREKNQSESSLVKSDEVIFQLQNSERNHSKELANVVQYWTELSPDVCLISQDRTRIFTQR